MHGNTGVVPAQPTKPVRPWYRKKRWFILAPVAFLVVVGWIGSLGGDAEVADAIAPISTPSVEPTPDAAALAAQAEKEEAEAAEKAAEEAAAAAEAAEAAAAAAAQAAEEEAARGTVSQQNALRSAESYLDYTAFSRSGLIEQLEYEGFSTEDAKWGVDRASADWNEQAAASAESYLEYTSFSRSGLIEQLIYEGFSPEQAEFGVSQTGL